MKRLFLLLAAAGLAVPVPVMLPSTASAASRSWISDFCRADVPNTPPATVGDCVSLVNTFVSDSQGLVQRYCMTVEMFWPDDFYSSYDTLSECVRDGGSDLPPIPD